MKKAASWNGYLNKARFGGVNQGLIYVLVGVVVVVLLALPMVHKMGNNGEGEGTPAPIAENNTQAQGNTDPVKPAEWRTDYEAIKAHAESTGQVLLVYIYSEASEQCKLVEREVFGNAEFQQEIIDYLKVKVHVDNIGDEELRQKAFLPGFVFIKSGNYVGLGLSDYEDRSQISGLIGMVNICQKELNL